MNSVSNNYINQYRIAFYISWIVLYFIFPAWYNPQIYISFTNEIIDVPYRTHIMGFVLYFFAAAIILNLLLNKLVIDEPLVVHSDNRLCGFKDNLSLVIICCIAAALHVFSYSLALGNSNYSLWIYRYITYYWDKLAAFPIQYPAWLSLVILFVILKVRRLNDFVSGFLSSAYSIYKSSPVIKLISLVVLVAVFFIYTKLLPDYSVWDHLFITGEPPVGTILYLIIYLLFGTTNIFLPSVIVQMIFYLLGGVFLYRTISLFHEKKAAMLGASIYLFSPLIFTYATLGHLQSGVVFFIILNSYFFLKFIRDGRSKDLLLTAYFISIGCLYKREIILMFPICSAYLMGHSILQKDYSLKKLSATVSILSIPVLSFLPWYFIGTRGADGMVLSNFTATGSLFSYLLMVPTQLSWPIFSLVLVSFIFAAVTRKNHLSIFFAIVLVLYYALYTSLAQQTVHRYSMAFYPAISFFLAQFIYGVSRKVRWKNAFNVAFTVLIIYLAALCVIPRSATRLVTFKYTDFENQMFPTDEAADWIFNNTGSDERVLILYEAALNPEKKLSGNKFISILSGQVNSLMPSGNLLEFRQNLKHMCENQNISYVMFPGGDAITLYPLKSYMELEIKKYMEHNMNEDFVPAAKFGLDDNYIFIYKIKR